MQENDLNNQHSVKWMLGRPVVIAIAVAFFGAFGMLMVDHGSWNRPHAQTAASYRTTGEAARAVGATVTPTEPKRGPEPAAPGPKPAAPPNPVTK